MNKKLRISIEIIISICLLLVLYYLPGTLEKSALRRGPSDIDSGYRLFCGTLVRIIAVAENPKKAKDAIESAFEQFDNIEQLMSIYREDSEFSRINRDGYKMAVKLSPATFDVLQKALKFSKLSEGAFDITAGPLTELWLSAKKSGSIPSDDKIAEARSRVDYEKLILDANTETIRFAVDGMKLDAGGIAKGYAIDMAVEAMKSRGAIGGMVDAGGDIRCFGQPPQGKNKWLITLQDPKQVQGGIETGRPLLTLELTDAAVATSGDYRRFALIDEKKYSHIIDTETGSGSTNLSSVTVICKDATDADALATTVSLMGKQKGLELIESLDQTEAILISPGPEYELILTKKAQQYIHK